MNTQIELEIRDYIARNVLFAESGYPLPDEVSFVANGVIDSMGVMELVEFVSSRFGIDIPQADITPQNFDSVSRLADYIRRRSGKADQLISEPMAR